VTVTEEKKALSEGNVLDMRSLLTQVRTRGHLAVIVASVLVIGYIGLLVGLNYLSNLELRESALRQLRQDTENRAAAVSYFCSERKNDLRNLAASRAISAFFENKALGMSMEYGLRASLLGISETFHSFLRERKLGKKRLYTRIVLLDKAGKLLVDSRIETPKQEHQPDWKKLVAPENPDPAVLVMDDGHLLRMIVSAPYLFKGKYAGQLIAWISPETVYHLGVKQNGASKQRICIVCEKGHVYFPREAEQELAFSCVPDPHSIEVGTPYRFDAIDKNGDEVNILAFRVPVRGTLLSVLTLVPSSEMFGCMAPWHLPLAMGLLAVIILCGMAAAFRINAQRLILHARLEEAFKRELEIQQKNQELEAEVAIRKQAQKALHKARDELELRVKERTDQLLQAQKMEAVGRLAGGIAHDFNNLLTTIIGNTELSLLRIGKDNPLCENIAEIKKAANRAASLTRQLLAFSRKQVLQPVVLNLNTVICGLEKMIGRLIGEDMELETLLSPDLGEVRADAGQMEQVIMNLVINARDAMPLGGKLIIETANVDLDETYASEHGVKLNPGPYVMLAVSDTGKGMDKETQAHIFEPFFTTKERGKGTGLGLSTVYGIVKQSGGLIWVYSELGEGTTFKIYLPRIRSGSEPQRKEQAPLEAPKGVETVLIVEDDDAVRSLACKILELQGYKILEAKDGEEAMKVSKEHNGPIHLMITDVVMPGISGRELQEQLHPLRPAMKVLYMSGYTDNATAHHKVLDSGVAFLQKPFTPETLARKVREVLED